MVTKTVCSMKKETKRQIYNAKERYEYLRIGWPSLGYWTRPFLSLGCMGFGLIGYRKVICCHYQFRCHFPLRWWFQWMHNNWRHCSASGWWTFSAAGGTLHCYYSLFEIPRRRNALVKVQEISTTQLLAIRPCCKELGCTYIWHSPASRIPFLPPPSKCRDQSLCYPISFLSSENFPWLLMNIIAFNSKLF